MITDDDRLYVVIGGTHEVGVVAVMSDEDEANDLAARLNGGGGYVEVVQLDEPTDFGKQELNL
jgi:hypothetical protein